MRRDIPLQAYRAVVRFSLLLSVAGVVFGLYRLLQADYLLGALGVVLGVVLLLPSQFFRVRTDPAAETLLVLVTKKDCQLCVEARDVIRRTTEGTPFTLQEVDIADHRHLRRYKNLVPVLFWQGEEVARLRIEPDALRRRLDHILAARQARARGV